MALKLDGHTKWGGTKDNEGHRTYKITHLVLSSVLEGPNQAANAAGLPLTGSFWNFDLDQDVWAFCYPEKSVTLYNHTEGEPHKLWAVESTFSTKPLKRCQDTEFEDPLDEPDKVSGSFVKYTKEIDKDKDGNLIRSSSYEVFRGAQMEFDHNRPQVVIGQNVADLELDVISSMVDTVNSVPMWGLPVRCVKLSNAPWTKNFYGSCSYYYTRTFTFDIDFNTFDRTVWDEGTKCLRGQNVNGTWVLDTANPPSATNPLDFQRYKDSKDENSRTLLNGAGVPLPNGGTPVDVDVQYYGESNFFQLGITTEL